MDNPIAAKANEIAAQLGKEQLAFEEQQRALAERFRQTEAAILPIFDGWTVAEVELFLSQVVMQRVRERATFSMALKNN